MRPRLDDGSLAESTGRPLVARRYLGAWLVLLLPAVIGIVKYYTYPDLGLFTWRVGERLNVTRDSTKLRPTV